MKYKEGVYGLINTLFALLCFGIGEGLLYFHTLPEQVVGLAIAHDVHLSAMDNFNRPIVGTIRLQDCARHFAVMLYR